MYFDQRYATAALGDEIKYLMFTAWKSRDFCFKEHGVQKTGKGA